MQRSEPVADIQSDGPSPRVGDAIANYAAALDSFGGNAMEGAQPVGLGVILARDALARALADASGLTPSGLTPETLSRVSELDSRLRAQATRVAIGHPILASWRVAMQAPASAWWWSLDDIAETSVASLHPVWTILAGAFITLAVSLATEISLRFLSGGPDFLGLLSTFSQALLALLAGSAFTRVGGEWIDRSLSSLHVARSSHGAWKTAFAFAVLAAVVALRLALPAMSRLYNDRGVHLQQAGRVTRARQYFERAIRLNPDYAQGHYNLASAKEETSDYEAALGEYQQAIKLDERFYAAYNNLARLYMLRRGDYGSALELLDRGIALAPKNSLVQYSLHKNRGWANFGLKYLLQAEDDLREAVALRPQGAAAAHCLLAQVLEAQKNEAMTEWEDCIAYSAVGEEEVEASWLGLALERTHQKNR